MKKLLLALVTIFVCTITLGQSVVYFRADTIVIKKEGGFSNLKVEDATKDSLGVATNIGGGVQRFKRSRVINDSTILVGNDTLIVRGGESGTSNLTIGDVNNAIAAAINDLPIYMDEDLFTGSGASNDRYAPDTVLYIETKYHSKLRIDSIIANWPTPGEGGGVIDAIGNTTGTGEGLWIQINDSIGRIKKVNAGTNVTFTVTDSIVTINSSSGSAEVNADSLTSNASTEDIIINGSAMLAYVMVKPASNITSFSIGTVAEPTKFFPATPVVATAEYVVFDVGAYIQGTTLIRFSGLTAVTDILAKFEPIHK